MRRVRAVGSGCLDTWERSSGARKLESHCSVGRQTTVRGLADQNSFGFAVQMGGRARLARATVAGHRRHASASNSRDGTQRSCRLGVTVSAKRDEARGDERRVVDRRLIAELEVALEPSRPDARVPLRLLLGDQDRQLEQLGEGRPAERAERRLGHLKVLTLDRPVENRPWMTLRSRGAFQGAEGGAV